MLFGQTIYAGCPVKLTAEEVKNLNESRIKPLYEV